MAEWTLFEPAVEVKFFPDEPPYPTAGRICAIYAIVHRTTRRVYVGSSDHLYRRWAGHRQHLEKGDHHARHLQHAWNKYGPDAFEWRVLQLSSQATLMEDEQKWIDHFKAADKRYGFNQSPIAGRTVGHTQTEDYRRRLGDRMRGKPMNPKARAKLQQLNYGNKYAKGFKNNARITKTDVKIILQRAALGESNKSLGAFFGLSPRTIQNIRRRQRWKDVRVPKSIIAAAALRRDQRGENGATARLKEADVREILRRSALGETNKALAAEFGVDRSAITKIRRRKLWSHLVVDPAIERQALSRRPSKMRKLSDAELEELGQRMRTGESPKKLIAEYGVSSTLAYFAKHGKARIPGAKVGRPKKVRSPEISEAL